MKYIIGLFVAIFCLACGPQTKIAFTPRTPARTFVVVSPNVSAKHEQNLRDTIDKSIAEREFDDDLK